MKTEAQKSKVIFTLNDTIPQSQREAGSESKNLVDVRPKRPPSLTASLVPTNTSSTGLSSVSDIFHYNLVTTDVCGVIVAPTAESHVEDVSAMVYLLYGVCLFVRLCVLGFYFCHCLLSKMFFFLKILILVKEVLS